MKNMPTAFRRIVLPALAGVLIAPAALGQVIFSDSFESYTDDASLTAVWTRVTGTSSTIGLNFEPGNTSIFQTVAAGRLRHVIPGGVSTANGPVTFSFDLYDNGPTTQSGRVFAEIRNSASATGLFAAGIYNSVNVGTYDLTRYQARNLDGGGWIQLAAPRSVGWHNFRFELTGNTASLYVDNVLDPAFTAQTYAGNITYDWLHVGSALTGNSATLYDNIRLAIVPEPSALALGLLAFAVLFGRRSSN